MADRSIKPILRRSVVWYLLLIILPTVTAKCNETFDQFTCEFYMFCVDDLEISRSWDYFGQNRGYHNVDNCRPGLIYNGEEMFRFNLILSNSYYYDELPRKNDNYGTIDYIINSIISLELRNINYDMPFPSFKRMKNLLKLNLSKNSFGIARLSNINELPSLKDIDLSHNTIRDIIFKVDDDNEAHFYNFDKLESINLSYNFLEKVPEAIFDSLNYLTILDLSHNLINSLSPITFEGMKKLEQLNMSHNDLSGINASLFRFSELKTLDLSNNKLKSIKAIDFHALSKLTTLNLKCNFISNVDKDTFENLRILQRLDISDNELEMLDKDTFKNVDNLQVIMISKNKFKTLPISLFKGKVIMSFSIFENILEGSIERGMFEGLQLVSILDLSNQHLELIENNAFYGLGTLQVLLLQNNNIKTLSSKCFNMLIHLNQLDLSYNKITNIDFEKENLGNLESLSIRNNYLTVVKHEHFQGLDSLQVLDLSDNKISRLESNAFKSLKNLISFEISNNPLNGTLEENTFEGLNSLPSLDISCTLLTTIQNGSFNGMNQLRNLNISRSTIRTLQFNSFIHTGSIETLDLSYNKIQQFTVNNTQISKLINLYLNNNLIKTINAQTFNQMIHLTKIIMSYNKIESINIFTFVTQKDLRELDVSYNTNLMFDMSIINNTNNLNGLRLSGTKNGMTFKEIDVPVSQITIANASIVDVQLLKLNGLKHLDSLELSHNKILKVDFACFANISTLRMIDLSFNNITYIQPGTFKDNTMLFSLNLSHNYISSVTYGIFRGLIYLNSLDISYNKIDNLQNERFFEVRNLRVLIADHNRIETINAEEFLGLNLTTLSIGDNPIPCNVLVNFKRGNLPFDITAIKLDENNNENVKGITCNKNKDVLYNSQGTKATNNLSADTENIRLLLINIRDIDRDILTKLSNNDHEIPSKKDEEYLANITNQIAKFNNDNENQLSNLTKLISQIANKNETNILLEKILKIMTINSIKRPSTPAPITKNNATYDNLVNYINKLKQQLEDTIAFEKNNILNEVETKLSVVSTRNSVDLNPVNEKLSASPDSKLIFTEICVALILLILVCFVLYKFYKSGTFIRNRLSISTRELPDAMDSAL